MTRIRNNQNAPYWSAIATAAAYGQHERLSTRRIPIFFGFACSVMSLGVNVTKPFSDPKVFDPRVKSALDSQIIVTNNETTNIQSTYGVTLAVFDNSNKYVPFMLQRLGKAGNMVKVTARFYLKIEQGRWDTLK